MLPAVHGDPGAACSVSASVARRRLRRDRRLQLMHSPTSTEKGETMMMKLPKLLLAAAACAYLLGAVSLATAGNHLKCYKGKDSTGAKHKYSGGVLLSNTGLNPESGCLISTPPKICCDAVDKVGFADEN